MLRQWEDNWVRDGVANFDKVDDELYKLQEQREKASGRRGAALWNLASKKLGINKEKAAEATRGWGGVMSKVR